ncbi:MAG: hypothetical protein J5641_04155 [Bacteroidales bacterium]|nr:hypothetical protein [Bacteroidales bacterium]
MYSTHTYDNGQQKPSGGHFFSSLRLAKRCLLLCLCLLPLAAIGQKEVVRRLGDWLPDSLRLHGSMQGMAIHRRYAVALRDGGQCLILDMRHRRCVGAYPLTGNSTHCNNASFGHRRFVPSDPFPLLYVSSCYGDKACHVMRLLPDRSVTVQRIYYDSDCFPIAQDWCVDADNGYLYAFGGKRGGTMYLKKFALPPVGCEGADTAVRLTDRDVLQTIPITCVRVAQGSKIEGGYAYLPDGDQPGGYYLHIIDLASGKEVRTLDLNPIGLEPEGVDVHRRWIYVSFNTPDPLENKIIRFRR